jgi:hypothetical protein
MLGIIARLAATSKAARTMTWPMGKDLGIEGAAIQPPDPATTKPVIKLQLVTGGRPGGVRRTDCGTYLLFWLAYHPMLITWKRGGTSDLSYGVYLHGFPIQPIPHVMVGTILANDPDSSCVACIHSQLGDKRSELAPD